MSSKGNIILKGAISIENQKKLINALEILEEDPNAFDFLEPVDHVALNLFDYPTIITHPMDIGTLKKNLQELSYTTFQDFFADFELIWNNCRTYNMAGSEICKMANQCEKVFKKQIEKNFRVSSNFMPRSIKKTVEEESLPKEKSLEMSEKMNLTDKIRVLNNDGLSAIVKLLIKECPKGIEEIEQEKIQIKIDMIDKRTHELLLKAIDGLESNPSIDKEKNNCYE